MILVRHMRGGPVESLSMFLPLMMPEAVASGQQSVPAPPTVVVTAKRQSEAPVAAASRLPLTIRETPATVELLTQQDLQQRGVRTAREAFDQVVGAMSGNVPGNPAVVSMRGFAGNTVSILQDGVRLAASTVAQRDANIWHYDRIEILKGPASVLYGEGALAGVINKVTRKPVPGERHLDMLLSGGSFGTVFAAAGANLAVSPTVAVRADASYQRSDSLYDVDRNASFSAGLTASALYRPSDRLSLLIAVDHFEDRYDSTYQGLPLIPARYALDPSDAVRTANGLVADRALRRNNYNPRGAWSGADETTIRSRLDWAMGDGWTFALDLTGYTADRAFLLADTQSFVAPDARFPNGSIRQSYQDFRHDHRFWSVRGAVGRGGRIAGLRHRFTLGVEYNHTDFTSLRQQAPAGTLPDVDVRHPGVIAIPTSAAVFTSGNVTFLSRLKQSAVFAEDAVNLTGKWLLVGGLRWDHIALDRTTIQNLGGATDRNAPRFDPLSWRIGSSWAATPGLTVYAQYTTAVSPVSSILLASIANSRFRLTHGRAIEAGFKAEGWAGRASVTGAIYHIRQSDILTRDPINPSLSVQGGRQSSRGAEVSGQITPLPPLSLSVGASYTDARYDALAETIGGIRLDRSGNRPINIPDTTLYAAASYTITPGVTLGGTLRQTGGFYTDTANSIHVAGRMLLDTSLSLPIAKAMTLRLRGRNLTNRFYGEYSGYPMTNIYIGAPRSFEIALAAWL